MRERQAITPPVGPLTEGGLIVWRCRICRRVLGRFDAVEGVLEVRCKNGHMNRLTGSRGRVETKGGAADGPCCASGSSMID